MAQDGIFESDDFAVRLQLALNACNLSRSQISATLGVHKSLVSRWLSGEVKPSSYNLARISEMLARLKPGFNMTLWTAPLAEFETFLGISRSPPANPPRPAKHLAETVTDVSTAHVTGGANLNLSLGRMLRAIGAVVLVGLGIWGVSTMRESHRAQPIASSATKPTVVIPSVAVLPFLNLSGDPAKEYLGDGLSEEILNDLANTSNLHVASRSSSFFFKGKNAAIDEVARKLNVRAVLEGSVRQQGDRIRVVAQLINAADGFHLWSASYDRKLDDTLSVQEQIAGAIVVALTQKLAPPKPHRMIDPKAYQDYLQAQYFFSQRTGAAYRRANELLKDALARQPDFTAAYALRGQDLLFFAGTDRELQEESRRMTAAALRLEPHNQQALNTELIRALRSWDWETADRIGHRILARKERNALSYYGIAYLYQYMGFPLQALEARRRASELDPLQFNQRNNLAQTLQHVGRLPEAIAAAEAALDLQPGQPGALDELCGLYALTGKTDRARDYDRQLTVLATPSQPISVSNSQDYGRQLAIRGVVTGHMKNCEIQIAFETQPAPKVHVLLDQIKSDEVGSGALGLLYARAGDFTKGMKLFSDAYGRHEDFLIWIRYDAATPKVLLQDPRWIALWQRPLLVDWQRHHDRLAAELATAHSVRSD